MLTIEHEHIVLLIMFTMINFNCIALNDSYLKNLIFYRHFFFVFIVRQKIYPPCNSKTLYVMFTESRQRWYDRDGIPLLLEGKK
jgi:hypothetical protein